MLDGKVVLVTGTSRGIGREIALRFAQNGATVYANARTSGTTACLVAGNDELRGKIIPAHFDVTDTSALKSTVMQIKKESGRLDCLVNNAGIMKDALIGMIDEQTMRDSFEVNVFAVMQLTQLTARLMMRQRSGSIINVASIIGTNGNAGQMVYSASKGAVIAMTKSAAKELAPYNIRVNAVAPGMIDTDLLHSVGKEAIEDRLRNIGMGRLGTPTDVANVCVFFASNLSEYVTGQIIGVDGAAII